jgi:hypothetical protein
MSQNTCTIITLADLGQAVNVELDPKITFAIATEFANDPIVQASEQLSALEAELAVAETGLAAFRSTNQRIGDLAIQKSRLEHAARSLLLERKGVKNLADLPLAVRGVVEAFRGKILAMDTTYQSTCKELAKLHRQLEMSDFDAHMTAKINLEAAISAILEAPNG